MPPVIPQQKKNETQPRDRRRTVLRHEISFSTMMQAVLFAAGIWVLIELLPVVLVLVVALIIVGTMSPAVHWLKMHGMRRGAGITIVFMAFVIAALLLITLTTPVIVQQAANLIEQE